jgi:asparagine synthase (glutamine-hydrolysing)
VSSFTGVYHFDGKPVDPEMVASMGPTIARKGPDGGNDYCDGPLGMSYRAFHTTRESHWEVQPMVGPSGEVLCWDGRLDNREELQTQLCVPRVPSDAELVMAAYRKWGEEFLAHLIGDFALAIFDPKERQILLGRDFFGPRPLFYLLQAEKLMWSTDLLPLMQHGGVDLALDDDYIAQFLVLSIEPHRTPYRNVRSVEPGHVVAFRDGKLRKNTWYWKPDPAKDIRYKTDREYEENFYALFRQSVKARLRSDGPVWADLSGGLDSSSIVCMADEIMTQETVDCPRLDTYTAINGKSILTNELPYVTLVEQLRGRSGFHLREDDLWFNATRVALLRRIRCSAYRSASRPLRRGWTGMEPGSS